ncbi:thiamine diphosphate-binding protein [Cunninghamella echinulata]|nr:thiamine diphosphate-binding protein [Cunninghamella echinulata]
MAPVKTTIGLYLLKRIKEVGVDTIFGLPGDFNMKFLDLIEDDPELLWGNNANELNAAYAADGYARIKGVGALVTTFGVGELSAMNGIAGAYSEMLPVIHIVGTPNTSSQAAGAILHHTLGNGDFNVFVNMFASITAASVHLTATQAARQIDSVISESVRRKRPGYIGIPIDLVNHEIEVELAPLDCSIPKNPKETQEAALKAIITAIKEAKRPIIIADACVLRNHMKSDLAKFIQVSQFPSYVTPMGKSAIEPDTKGFRGCYTGSVSLPQIGREVHSADLILEFGSVQTDFNTGGFTYKLDQSKIIAFHSFTTRVFYSTYERVCMQELLPLLIDQFPQEESGGGEKRKLIESVEQEFGPPAQRAAIPDGETMIQNFFWNILPQFLPEKSVIVTETGTSTFGSFNMHGNKDSIFISQILYGSIGYSVPACLGAALADRSRRVYLIVGDGSFQLTAQEVAVMLHHGITPVIIIFNNDGYLIEKLIHGPNRSYNNFQMWDYAKSFDYFGANIPSNETKATVPYKIGVQKQVKSRKEFLAAMELTLKQPDRIHLVEVIFPQFDAPVEVELQARANENH